MSHNTATQLVTSAETERMQRLWNGSPQFRANNPDYWLRRNRRAAGDRTAERVADLPHQFVATLGKFVGGLQRAVAAQRTPAAIEPVVAEWAGRLAKYVHVETVKTVRRGARILILRVDHPAVRLELRPQIGALQRMLERSDIKGIQEVRL